MSVARWVWVLSYLLISPHPVGAQKFYADDPVWEDDDRLPIPKPLPIERSDLYDLLFHSFVGVSGKEIPAAQNVNTLGEVPDSSWFRNRMTRGTLSLDELARGPNEFDSPDLSKPLEVVSIKAEGRSPGFTVEDARDHTYILKFDPRGHAQLTTSAEAISTRFFHAFGYHVPENYLLFVRERDFVVSPEGTIDEAGRTRPIEQRDIEFVLRRVGRRSDGSHPALASRFLSGSPLGPFSYHGTRSDDPNDIFPHEHRRELRGLRVFSAWLEHHDSRSLNTLDMYIPRGDRGYVRHHLIDFGSTLGATPLGPRDPRQGHEYFFAWEPTWKAALSAGVWDRPWRGIRYPDFSGVGRIEAESFDPAEWRPEYPNPVFDRMLVEDAFWAAKIVHRFTDEMVRTIVEVGRLDDSAAEEYLVNVLIRRRDEIVRHYFAATNPLDRFRVDAANRRLRFDNLGVEAGLAAEAAYGYQWFRFGNDSGSLDPLEPPKRTERHEIPIPESSAPFLMVRVRTRAEDLPRWHDAVDVYLCLRSGMRAVVGVERGTGAGAEAAESATDVSRP